MDIDWRYSQDKMDLRSNVLMILLLTFGGKNDRFGKPKHKSQLIYECAHDWVSQGNNDIEGVIKYFEDNYVY